MNRLFRGLFVEGMLAPFALWQARFRNPILSILLVLQLFLVSIALPLAAIGLPIGQNVTMPLLLVVLSMVVILSHRALAILIILAGLTALAGNVAFSSDWLSSGSVLSRGGAILVFSALTWVVADSVYAPGRVTIHRLQGAVVVYLSVGIIFASAFSFLRDLRRDAFANLPADLHGPKEFATMLYFSMSTLTTTGYGDIVPLNPFVRSLANLEAVLGQFYFAVTVARLVTLEMADRGASEESHVR